MKCEQFGVECGGYGSSSPAVSSGKVAIGKNVEIGANVEIGGVKMDAKRTGEGSVQRTKKEEVNAKEEEEEETSDWEEITHTDALPAGKPGEFGVLELDE